MHCPLRDIFMISLSVLFQFISQHSWGAYKRVWDEAFIGGVLVSEDESGEDGIFWSFLES